MTPKQSRFVEYLVFLIVVVLVAGALGALMGLYGERIGLPSATRTLFIVLFAIVVGRLFSRRFARRSDGR